MILDAVQFEELEDDAVVHVLLTEQHHRCSIECLARRLIQPKEFNGRQENMILLECGKRGVRCCGMMMMNCGATYRRWTSIW